MRWLVQADLAARRAAFDTDARIVHRLLSQQAAQHDAMLATLTLLQPGAAAASSASPETRLPALYPQVLKVLRRGDSEAWPAPLARAEAESAALRRPVLAGADMARGQFTLVQAGTPASFALRIDAAAAVPWADWPLPRDGPVRDVLRHGDASWVLQPGAASPGWRLLAEKRLASDSQPFTVVVTRALGIGELPWARLLLWCVAVAAAAAALAAWQRQRETARRAAGTAAPGPGGAAERAGRTRRRHGARDQPAAHRHAGQHAGSAAAARRYRRRRSRSRHRAPGTGAGRAAGAPRRRGRRPAAPPGAAGRQPPPRSRCGWPTRCDSVLYLLAPQVEAAGVQTELHGLDDAPAVLADPVALEQIVHNLVNNALQALAAVTAAGAGCMIDAAATGDGVRAHRARQRVRVSRRQRWSAPSNPSSRRAKAGSGWA